jgi:hypothetical protein
VRFVENKNMPTSRSREQYRRINFGGKISLAVGCMPGKVTGVLPGQVFERSPRSIGDMMGEVPVLQKRLSAICRLIGAHPGDNLPRPSCTFPSVRDPHILIDMNQFVEYGRGVEPTSMKRARLLSSPLD